MMILFTIMASVGMVTLSRDQRFHCVKIAIKKKRYPRKPGNERNLYAMSQKPPKTSMSVVILTPKASHINIPPRKMMV